MRYISKSKSLLHVAATAAESSLPVFNNQTGYRDAFPGKLPSPDSTTESICRRRAPSAFPESKYMTPKVDRMQIIFQHVFTISIFLSHVSEVSAERPSVSGRPGRNYRTSPVLCPRLTDGDSRSNGRTGTYSQRWHSKVAEWTLLFHHPLVLVADTGDDFELLLWILVYVHQSELIAAES
jgi:hypothetical protein